MDFSKVLISPLLLATAITGCGKTGKPAVAEVPVQAEEYHADNDIAMTVMSIADALRIGEPLDSAEYDFEGVLTDGQGSPLYTDVQGSPGEWEVNVLDNKTVSLRNLFLGDLLAFDLEDYLLESLGADDSAAMEFEAHEAVNEDETQINVYDCGDVYMRFEVRSGIAANGLEGPLLTVVLTSECPSGVIPRASAGKQISGKVQTSAKP